MANEIWRPVTSHVGLYEVSNLGRVRSLSRDVPVHGEKLQYVRRMQGRILKPGFCGVRQYQCYSLWNAYKLRPARGSWLVLEAFVGPRPAGAYACHRDDNALNDALSNLYWGTPKENSADKIRHGNQPRGEAITWSRLTDDDVREIVRLSKTCTVAEIARRFDLTYSHAWKVVHRRQWAHVSLEEAA